MKNIARTTACALALSVLVAAFSASAEDARSAAVGATIKDGALNIGTRTWKLPPGDWKLAGRVLRHVRLSEVRGGAEVIEVYSALLQDRGLRVGLMMTGPTGPDHGAELARGSDVPAGQGTASRGQQHRDCV